MMTESDDSEIFDDPELMKLVMELHSGNPREGPEDNESTLRALRMVTDLPERPDILDVGCGPGMQTLTLAKATNGWITALDNHQPFLDALDTSAQEKHLDQTIKTTNGSMFELPFEPALFDLIWSEGAIYIIGFERGLKEWGDS